MTKRRLHIFLDHHDEMTDIEKELDNIETSWADFAHAINPEGTARVVRRDGENTNLRPQSLVAVHAHLEVRRNDFEQGDRSALFYALMYCAEENVPLPYWIGNELLNISSRLRAEPTKDTPPSDLHREFGFDKTLPATGTKAVSNRRKQKWANKIWFTTRTIMADQGISSVDAAVKMAIKKLDAPYAVRAATAMFNEVEQRQKKLTKPFK